jgi:hypothetical protein
VGKRPRKAGSSAPTPAAINKLNEEFWKRENERLLDQARNYPHEIVDAAALATKLIAEHIRDPKFATETSINARSAKFEQLRRQTNVARGKRGSLKSGDVRRKGTVERDERWFAARRSGKKVKQIANDPKFYGEISTADQSDAKKQKARLQRVYRVLARFRP